MQSADILTALNAALLHSLWQITLISAFAWLALRLIPEKYNSVRYAVSTFCLVLIPVVFSLTFIGFEQTSLASQYTDPIANPYKPSISLPALWMLTTLFGLFELYANWMGVRHLNQAAFQKPDTKLTDMLISISQKMKIYKTVELRLLDICASPGTIGFWRPIIFLPLSCLTQLSELEIEAILAHELAHIRRHDYIWTWLRSFIKVVFYFHPGTHFLIRNIARETEYACDALALKGGGNSTALATGLLRLMLPTNNTLILNVSPVSNPELGKRIERLTGVRSVTRKPRRNTNIIFITMMVITAFVWVFVFSHKQIAHASTTNQLNQSHLSRVELVALKDAVCDKLWEDSIYNTAPYDDGGLVQITYSDNVIEINNIPLPNQTQTKIKTIFQAYGLDRRKNVKLRYYHDYVTLES